MIKNRKNLMIFIGVGVILLLLSRFIWAHFFEGNQPLDQSSGKTLSGAQETSTGSNIILDTFEYTPKKIDLTQVGEVPSVAKVCLELQKTKDYYQYIRKFYQENKQDFLKIYIGDSDALPSISGNQIYYVFDNCDDLDVGTPLHGECSIRMRERDIFMPSLGRKVSNIVGLSEIDFVQIQNDVQNGNCKNLKNNKFFEKYSQFCGNEKGYIEYLNQISFGFLQALCGK